MKKIFLGLILTISFLNFNMLNIDNDNESIKVESLNVKSNNSNEYKFGEGYGVKTKFTKHDTGFSEKVRDIEEDDLHYGWDMGYFSLTGYAHKDENTFYKTSSAGKVNLEYTLLQNLEELDHKSAKISEDKDGYIKDPSIEQQNMGEGYFVLEFFDEFGNKEIIQKRNFFHNTDADEELQLNQEGKYRVTLVYELKEKTLVFFNRYEDYKVQFEFNLMNGISEFAVYDTVTNLPMANKQITYNEFTVDFLASSAMEVKVKWEILNTQVTGDIDNQMYEKIIFNGEKFKEVGRYTITATHKSLNLTNSKVIYIGCGGFELANSVLGINIEDYYSDQINYDQQVDEILSNSKDGSKFIIILLTIIIVVAIIGVGIIFVARR